MYVQGNGLLDADDGSSCLMRVDVERIHTLAAMDGYNLRQPGM